jgi:hypothetical protein
MGDPLKSPKPKAPLPALAPVIVMEKSVTSDVVSWKLAPGLFIAARFRVIVLVAVAALPNAAPDHAKSKTSALVWYLGMLVPVTGIVPQVDDQAMADRYVYLPMVGLSLTAIWTTAESGVGLLACAPAKRASLLDKPGIHDVLYRDQSLRLTLSLTRFGREARKKAANTRRAPVDARRHTGTVHRARRPSATT